MRTLLAATLIAASATLAATAADPASAVSAVEPPTCNGKIATLFEANGPQEIRGTTGNDVIVATEITFVEGKGGNDTICIRGTQPWTEVMVILGDGNDFVDASQSAAKEVFATLAGGDDEYIGSPDHDLVFADGAGGTSDVDLIRTGPGVDAVEVGHDGFPMADTVDLGPDGGSVGVRGVPQASAKLTAGPDGGILGMAGNGIWRVDATTGSLSNGQGQSAPIDGFNRFHFKDVDAAELHGDSSSEDLLVEGVFPFTALMGGGDDAVQLTRTFGKGRIVGGPGRDRVEFYATPGSHGAGDLKLDLGKHQLSGVYRDQTSRSYVDVENANVVGVRTVTLVGDGGANTFEVFSACSVRLDGRAGKDLLRVGNGYTPKGCVRPSFVTGGSGNDTLTGSDHRDFLDGGTGQDRAYGRAGRDTCRAEIRVNCER